MVMLGIDVVSLVGLMGVLVFAAHFFAWLFSYTKIPDALLLLFVGLIIGPVLGLLPADYLGQSSELLVMLALIVLLFEGGLDLPWSALKSSWRDAVVLTVASFGVMMFLVSFVLWLFFSFDPTLALAVGAIVGGTSSAVVIPLLEQIAASNDGARTLLTLESVLSDVLAIVLTLALIEAHTVGFFSITVVSWGILVSFFGAALFGVTAALLWARLLSTVRHMQNSLFTTPAIVFIVFGAAETIGLNGLITVLAFGILLGNVGRINAFLERRSLFVRYLLQSTELARRERLFFEELAFLLQTFFFVFVGFSLQLQTVSILLLGFVLVLAMVPLRLLVVRQVMSAQVPAASKALSAIMIPKGLAAAALASLVAQRGLAEGPFVQELVYAIILFSVLAASVLIFLLYRGRLGDAYLRLLGGSPQGGAVDRPFSDRMV